MHTRLPDGLNLRRRAAAWSFGRVLNSHRSLRGQIVLLCAGLALPILLLVGALTWQFAKSEQRRLRDETLDAARTIALAIDRELAGLRAASNVLSLSAYLRSGDLAGFHQLTADLLRREGITTVLRLPSGQQVVNPHRPFGEPLPVNRLSIDQQVVSGRASGVSDMFKGAVTKTYFFTIVTPVIRDGEVTYLLSHSLPVERIRTVITEQGARSGWTIAVIDRAGTILARNHRHDEFAGRPATPDLQANTRDREGTWRGVTADGQPVFAAYARSRLSDWRVAVGVREADLAAPLHRSLWFTGFLGVGLALLSALLASYVGQRITHPIQALALQADALGRGEPVGRVETSLAEVSRVGEALAEASAVLRSREQALKASEARLTEILESIHDYYFVLDAEFRITNLNRRIEEVTGKSRAEIIGKKLWDVFPKAKGPDAYGAPPRPGERTVLHREIYSDVLERWVEATLYRTQDCIEVFFRDVSARKGAEAALKAAEERYRLAARATNDAIWDWDLAANHVLWNDALQALFGHDREAVEPTGDWWLAQVHPDDRARIEASIHPLIEGSGTHWSEEYRFRRADGSYADVFDRGTVIRDESGRAVRMIGAMLDLSARKRAERELAENQARLQAILDTVPVGIVFAEAPSGRITGGNAQVERIFGHPVLPSRDVEGYRDWIGFHADGRRVEASEYPLSKVIRDGAGHADLEVLYRRGDGREAWIRILGAPIKGADGAITGGVVACLDIDREKQAEAALRETTRQLDAILNNTTMAVFMMDERQQCVYMNAAAEQLTGYTLLETQGRALHDVVHHTRPDGSPYPLCECPIDQAFPENNQEQGEEVFVHKDGSFYPVAFTASPIRNERGQPVGTVIEARNIEEDLRARAALEAFQATLEARVAQATAERDRIWQVSRDLLGVATFEGYFESVNPAWERVLGWSEEEVRRTLFLDLVHPDDRAATLAEVARLELGEVTLLFENRYRSKDGSYRRLAWMAVPEGGRMYCVARDVTKEREAAEALRRTEEQLRQSQKMEAVGRLTGGVAHDFNNLLTVVTGNLDMLRGKLERSNADWRALRNVDNALEGAKRAAHLTHRLLAFSRQSPLKPERVDANRLVGGMSDLLRRTLGETIAIETVLAGGLWPTLADANQLENALLNLAVNARDAMPEGGKLTIETANCHLDEAYSVGRQGEVKPGQYVMVAVSDTGSGMSAEVLARVFEPFFTTKPVGKGTGLGLAQVYGFAKQSEGHVAIYSEVGHGTTVKLYFPRLRQAEGQAEASEESVHQAPALTFIGAGELVLVVEDEAMVREFTVAALEDAGFEVIAAEDGPTALALLDQHLERIAVLFTDVVLSGPLNGRKVADAALAKRPDLKVLFTTGYTRNAIIHQGRLDEGVELITKPFTAGDLTRRIRTLIDTA